MLWSVTDLPSFRFAVFPVLLYHELKCWCYTNAEHRGGEGALV